MGVLCPWWEAEKTGEAHNQDTEQRALACIFRFFPHTKVHTAQPGGSAATNAVAPHLQSQAAANLLAKGCGGVYLSGEVRGEGDVLSAYELTNAFTPIDTLRPRPSRGIIYRTHYTPLCKMF